MAAKKTTISKPKTDKLVTLAELCECFGVSDRTISNWKNDGLNAAVSRDRYSMPKAIRWFADREIQLALSRQQSEPEATDIKDRKLLAEARMKEVELARMIGELVNIEDAKRDLEKHLGIVRAALLAFPARFAPFAVMITDVLSARVLLDAHVAEMMRAIVSQAEQPEEELPEADDND
ncbi:MAG TPA: hypothetical protein VGM77_11180 [Gemmatimonadales bacterium]|jgi:phage terminase Nu1 subunit (DNA packaging protein)